MREVSFFHRETGIVSGVHVTASDDSLVAANTPVDHIAIDGHIDHLSKRVDVKNVQFSADENGNQYAHYSVIEWMPPAPSQDHVWNPESKRWQLNAAAAEKLARSNLARAQIAELESAQHRHVREHCLGLATATEALARIHEQIVSLERDL